MNSNLNRRDFLGVSALAIPELKMEVNVRAAVPLKATLLQRK